MLGERIRLPTRIRKRQWNQQLKPHSHLWNQGWKGLEVAARATKRLTPFHKGKPEYPTECPQGEFVALDSLVGDAKHAVSLRQQLKR
jgi:hypothetical protein